jgi:hypothetical protein
VNACPEDEESLSRGDTPSLLDWVFVYRHLVVVDSNSNYERAVVAAVVPCVKILPEHAVAAQQAILAVRIEHEPAVTVYYCTENSAAVAAAVVVLVRGTRRDSPIVALPWSNAGSVGFVFGAGAVVVVVLRHVDRVGSLLLLLLLLDPIQPAPLPNRDFVAVDYIVEFVPILAFYYSLVVVVVGYCCCFYSMATHAVVAVPKYETD